MILSSPEEYLNRLVERDNLAEIKLGLERIAQVWAKLKQQLPPLPFIYTVAGTNGKGTCCALLEQALRAHGLTTGLISSPHLLSFNERACVNGMPAKDGEWLEALRHISEVKGKVPLTYFEYCTLAAILIFSRRALDLWILEVGLGGRLDAVNILDADCAVITSIALDHTEILGSKREQIAAEKFAIARRGRSVVIGEPELHDTFTALNKETGAKLLLINRDFGLMAAATGRDDVSGGFESTEDNERTEIAEMFGASAINEDSLFAHDAAGEGLRLISTKCSKPVHPNTLAAAWQAVNLYQPVNGVGDKSAAKSDHRAEGKPSSQIENRGDAKTKSKPSSSKGQKFFIDKEKTSRAWQDFQLAGRWQRLSYAGCDFILDCAHNPAAAKQLASNLAAELKQRQDNTQVEAIFAMQANKDWRGFLRELSPLVSHWHLFTLASPKGLPASDLARMLQQEQDLAAMNISVYKDAQDLMSKLFSSDSTNAESRGPASNKSVKRSGSVETGPMADEQCRQANTQQPSVALPAANSPRSAKLFLVCGSFHTLGELLTYF